MGFCTKERKGVAAEILMATPCTKSLGGEGRGYKDEGKRGGRLSSSDSPRMRESRIEW